MTLHKQLSPMTLACHQKPSKIPMPTYKVKSAQDIASGWNNNLVMAKDEVSKVSETKVHKGMKCCRRKSNVSLRLSPILEQGEDEVFKMTTLESFKMTVLPTEEELDLSLIKDQVKDDEKVEKTVKVIADSYLNPVLQWEEVAKESKVEDSKRPSDDSARETLEVSHTEDTNIQDLIAEVPFPECAAVKLNECTNEMLTDRNEDEKEIVKEIEEEVSALDNVNEDAPFLKLIEDELFRLRRTLNLEYVDVDDFLNGLVDVKDPTLISCLPE